MDLRYSSSALRSSALRVVPYTWPELELPARGVEGESAGRLGGLEDDVLRIKLAPPDGEFFAPLLRREKQLAEVRHGAIVEISRAVSYRSNRR